MRCLVSKNQKSRCAHIIVIYMWCVGMLWHGANQVYAQSITETQHTAQSNAYVDEMDMNIGLLQEQKDSNPLINKPITDIERPQTYQEIEVIGEGARYSIGPGDILQIMVRNQPDFSGRFVVNDDGYIQYNWVGDVKAAGLTKEELKLDIKEKLLQFIRYPEVSVVILEYKSKFVYVLGEVARPGKYPMKGDELTLRDAIVMSGLPTKTAAIKRTRVIRGSEDGPNTIKVNLDDILHEGKLENNYDLVPGDIIVIPRSRYHKTMDVVNKVVSPLFQALSIYEIGFGEDDNGLFRGDSD